MSVSALMTLPDQPTTGRSVLSPLGGNGYSAPHSCYLVQSSVAGDASAGTVLLSIQMDPRYTNLIAWINPLTSSAAAAGEFQIAMLENATSTVPGVTIVGTYPQVTSTFGGNQSFLWYPPPIYHKGQGLIQLVQINVDATEVYFLRCQVYCFAIDVLQTTPLPILQWNVPGVSAPASV